MRRIDGMRLAVHPWILVHESQNIDAKLKKESPFNLLMKFNSNRVNDEKPVVASWYACWNMFFGLMKKKKYEKKI